MSLKAFHIVFITASILLTVGFAAWCLSNFFSGGTRSDLVAGVISLVAAVSLFVYG